MALVVRLIRLDETLDRFPAPACAGWDNSLATHLPGSVPVPGNETHSERRDKGIRPEAGDAISIATRSPYGHAIPSSDANKLNAGILTSAGSHRPSQAPEICRDPRHTVGVTAP